MNIFSNKLRNNSGFTLIEIMVSLGIFAVVVVVSAAALLKILDANKKAQSIQNAMTNLNFAMESMTRELRTGTKYNCTAVGGDVSISFTSSLGCDSLTQDQSQPTTIAFKSADPVTGPRSPCSTPQSLVFAYRFVRAPSFDPSNPQYYLQKAKQANLCDQTSIDDVAFGDVISTNNVVITGYRVLVRASPTYPGYKYPIATIHVTGYAGTNERNKSYFDIQTAAAARLP